MANGREYPNDKIAAALIKHHGNMTAAAKAIGCTRQLIYTRARSVKLVRQALEESREVALDTAESALQRAVVNGDMKAITFTLRTIGRNRGYVERLETEVSGPGGGEIQITIIDPRKPGTVNAKDAFTDDDDDTEDE